MGCFGLRIVACGLAALDAAARAARRLPGIQAPRAVPAPVFRLTRLHRWPGALRTGNAARACTEIRNPKSAIRKARAFTLVEVLLTILIVGVGLVATMRALPVALRMSEASRQSMEAQQLATEMLSEIALLPFEDPDGSPGFGRETGESSATRADFDDIDDYDAWTACPPESRDGTTNTDLAAYRRSVNVYSVDVNDFTRVLADGSTDAKRITVTISCPGQPDVTAVTVRLKGVSRED
jgi:MSHA pilin protein MshD